VKLPLRDEVAKVLRHVQQAIHETESEPFTVLAQPSQRRSARPYIIAVDCPSGLDCDTGEIDQNALHADETVTFIAANKGHNSESILTLTPEGAEPWKGKINEEITVTFETEGSYAYKCQPHLGLGMVGLIQVGDGAVELDQAEVDKLPKRAAERLTELIDEAAAEQ